MTQEALAEQIGMSYSNLGRIERGLVPLGGEYVEPLAAALNIGAADLFREPAEAAKLGIVLGLGQTMVEDELPIRGEIRAGAWLETDDIDQREPERYPATRDKRFPRANQWLRRVRGDSMNALTKNGAPAGILDGDLVQLVDAIDIDYRPETDDIVEVERVRMGGREREITLKQVEVIRHATDHDPGEYLLWPRSSNPRWKDAVPYRGGVSDGEEVEVRVSGKVLQILRMW